MTVTIENNYTGNNSTTSYSFTFPYLDKSDVKASLDGIDTTNFTWSNATTINFNSTPGTGVAIRIYRDTAYDSPKATFYPGSAIRAGDLNDNSLQNLYVTQEANDKANNAWYTGAPTIISTETWYTTDDTKVATTKAIEARIDTKITAATTELAVSSLADGAARQVLQTAANGNDVEWTSNVDLPGTLDVTGVATLDNNLSVGGNTTFSGSVTATTFTGEATKIATSYGDHNANHYLVGVHPSNATGGVIPRTTGSLQYHPVDKKLYGGFDLDLSNTATGSQAYGLQTKKHIYLSGAATDGASPEIRMWELTGNGSDYVGLKAPNTITGSSYTVNLPGAAPTADKVLMAGSGGSVNQLVWGDVATATTANALSAAATVTAGEQSGCTPDDVSFFTTSASDARYDARYYNIGTTEEIQSGETWVADDTKVATTSAIDNRIVDLVDDIGGFVPLVDEGEIPQYHPEKENTTTSDRVGTILSIGTLTTTYTPSTGTCTIQASDLTNHSVNATITDCGSTVLAAGYGVLVETTAQTDAQYAAGPAFKFHRLVPKATEVTTVAGLNTEITTVAGKATEITTCHSKATEITTCHSKATEITTCHTNASAITTVSTNIADVNNFADLYQIASSAPSTDGGSNSLAAGDLYFNTSSNELQVYNGSAWQGGVTATGNLVAKAGDTMTGNLVIDNAKEIRLSETDANGSHYLGFKAPDSVTANVTFTLPDGAGSNGQYLKTNGSGTLSWSGVTADEGTAILSTGESGGTKFLREDGDGTCSWQSVNLSAYAPLAGATFTGAIAAPSATFTDDGASQVVQIKTDDGAVYALRISNDTYSTSSLVGLRVYQEDDGDITLSHRGDSEYRQFWISQSDGTTTRPLYGGSTGGAAYLYHAGSSKLNTTASGITVTGSVTDDKGDVRNVPKNYKTSAYTLLASDAGKCITTEANVTIDPNVMSDGDVVTIVNNTTSNISIIRGTNVILHNSADATDSNKTLAGRGMCTMWFMNSAHAYITGAGLT